MRRIWLATLAFGMCALPTLAQEPEKEAAEAEKPARDERPHIQILKHPYDISSFYRSPGGARGFSYGFSHSERYSDRYGLYRDSIAYDSALPPEAFRPDLRGRYFSPRWDAEFDGSNPNFRLDNWGTRRRFERRRTDEREPRPAPSRQ